MLPEEQQKRRLNHERASSYCQRSRVSVELKHSSWTLIDWNYTRSNENYQLILSELFHEYTIYLNCRTLNFSVSFEYPNQELDNQPFFGAFQ